jgi:Cu/Ag efflux pump CusA
MIKGGYTETVGGIVMMIAGGNAKEVVRIVKERVDEINAKGMLPGGLRIVPYYDRSQLVDAALHTVSKVLLEGIVLVVGILFLFLGDLRSSIVVIATLVLTPALTFLVMNHYGMSANLMSLGGLAIAIGLLVDGSVVVVENVLSHLGHHPGRDRMQVVYDAVMEVGTPVIFGIGVIILVFLPLMTLEGMEGKMFAPLAYTIAIALGISLVLSLTLSPVLFVVFVERWQRARHVSRPVAQETVSLPAPLDDTKREKDHCRRRTPLCRNRFPLSLLRDVIYSRTEGRYDFPERRPCPQHLTRRIGQDGNGSVSAGKDRARYQVCCVTSRTR